jgi:glucose/arabinose dehydrogenase
MQYHLLTPWLLSCAFFIACGEDAKKIMDAGESEVGSVDTNIDAGEADAGGASDTDAATAVAEDAGPSDAGPSDAGPSDAGKPEPVCDASFAPVVPSLAVKTEVPAAAGLKRIVYAAQAPGSSAWYLVQQTGFIRKYENATLDPAPVVDLSEVCVVPDAGDERGLLGLAFAPDFQESKLFYVFVTPTNLNRDEVREYKLVDGKGELQRTLLTLPASAPNHNGGTLQFGPDGYLYVGTGDGGGGCNNDQPDAPQDPKSPFGKIHRLDPKLTAAPYAAAGNPYADGPTVLHVGFRNPFRFSIDVPSRTLIVGDVGQDSYEELNAVSLDTPGKNFGWGAFEGTQATCQGRSLGVQKEWERPIFAADRRGGGNCQAGTKFCDWKSVIGGHIYRGRAIPALSGTLLFGDYLGRRMVAITHCEGKTSPFTVINKICDPNDPREACLEGSSFGALTAIVRDAAGELYFVADGSQLLKLVPGQG